MRLTEEQMEKMTEFGFESVSYDEEVNLYVARGKVKDFEDTENLDAETRFYARLAYTLNINFDYKVDVLFTDPSHVIVDGDSLQLTFKIRR